MTNSSLKVGRAVILLSCLLLASSVSAQDCSNLAAENRQSVVSLSVEKTQKVTGAVTTAHGTGFIVTEDGYVLTANHVVARDPDTDSVKIEGAIGSLYGQKTPMMVVTADEFKDVALLIFLDDSRAYRPMPLSNPFKVQPGGQLCSLGYSAPLQADYQAVTGTLSSRRGQDLARRITILWTTQMPSNPGVSGAPVLDIARGGVVGMMYGGRPPGLAQNMNYLIPINMAGTILREYCNVLIPEGDGVSRARPEPTLESVQVKFVMPDGDDKDYDTKVAVQITKGNSIIASNEDIASSTKFDVPGNHGPFDLGVQPSITKAIYKDSLVRVSITPVGHDMWNSKIIVTARFSDNSQVRKEWSFILDQDVRQIQFQNP